MDLQTGGNAPLVRDLPAWRTGCFFKKGSSYHSSFTSEAPLFGQDIASAVSSHHFGGCRWVGTFSSSPLPKLEPPQSVTFLILATYRKVPDIKVFWHRPCQYSG